MVREYTNKLIELTDNEIISKEEIFEEMLDYFSEDDIRAFCLTSFGGGIAGEFEELEED